MVETIMALVFPCSAEFHLHGDPRRRSSAPMIRKIVCQGWTARSICGMIVGSFSNPVMLML
jgi:hypothetical protein